MDQIYKGQLFQRHYLVSEEKGGEQDAYNFEALFSLAAMFNIRIVSGEELAQEEMIQFVSKQLGVYIPAPFYRGFPKSVRKLSSDKLLFDQLFHYAKTYGLGMVEEAGHSIFESAMERAAFKEGTEIKDFRIITEREAYEKIFEIVNNLLLSSRPLSDSQYDFVLMYIEDFDPAIKGCASKNTAIRLLADSRNMKFVRFITMPDVVKLVDEINYRKYGSENIKKLNLKNQDRKFITKVIDALFDSGECYLETCCEKKAVWNGLLHHIHYKPRNDLSKRFVECMRSGKNLSVYSKFEGALSKSDVKNAVKVLRDGKGTTAVLRNLNYLLSRCYSQSDIDSVLSNIDSDNVTVLLQLLMMYANYSSERVSRAFVFTKYNKMKVHYETREEVEKRKSIIPEAYANIVFEKVNDNLRRVLKGRLGKVYIDDAMKLIALPIQENTSQGGVGVLPRGSRIPIELGKKIRAFTYWEKVDDIDLSVIGIDADRQQIEFSWRTMACRQSSAIVYSGDQTSGYYGGSEYFDINVPEFKKMYPAIKYLVFCDNVYSRINFSQCFCKAGFMLRDEIDSGEVFEPKTVQSSYMINCESTFAYLFGIDLERSELIWLNCARNGNATVAGSTSLDFLTKYFDVTLTMNMYTFFEMMATELVDDPSEAEIVVSDIHEGSEVIRSYDYDKVLALMK